MAARWVLMLGVLALLGLATQPARGNVGELEAYRGVWEYADGERGREAIERGIARAVADLPFFARPFAAAKIRDITLPFARVRFTISGDRLAFKADDWGPVSTRVGGPAEEIIDPVGSPLDLQQYVRNGRLVQVFTTDDGERENTFALSGDGQWIWMSVRVSSPRLPDDCRYRLRYRRVSERPAHAER